MRFLIDYFGGKVPLALAGYNAGHQRVVDCGFQIPAIKETQDFVTQVMGRYRWKRKRRVCPGPEGRVRPDGCVVIMLILLIINF